jgi:hypothetical protein
MGALANMATNMQSSQTGLKISTAIMKEVLDSQKQQGDMLVKMISQTPSADGAGKMVDILA